MTASVIGHRWRAPGAGLSAVRVLLGLALLVTAGAGCTGGSGRPATFPMDGLDHPPVVRLLVGDHPEGVLVHQEWVVDGKPRTSEAEAIPADLVEVPWRRDDQLRFEIASGRQPSWAAVLVYDELPPGRLPDTDPERLQCLPSTSPPQCAIDQSTVEGTTWITARPPAPGEIVILNVGWALPKSTLEQHPAWPPFLSASWVFAADVLEPVATG